jgi:hypothetical protein
MQEVVKYELTINKAEKNLYFFSVSMDGIATSGQAFGIGEAMNKASEIVYNRLENEGRVK